MGRKVRRPGKKTPRKRRKAAEAWNACSRTMQVLAELRRSPNRKVREEPGSLLESEITQAG